MANKDSTVEVLDGNVLFKLLSPRNKDAQKGDFGHVLVIGGHQGMGGAVRLAGEAAARVGAGLVSMALHPEYAAAIASVRPELMCYGIRKAQDLIPLLQKATVIVLGPGLGQDHWSQELYAQAIQTPKPKIVDADALNLLARQPQRRADWILTPHPGEAGRLLNCSAQEIQTDRLQAAAALQKKYGGVIVLKGAGTIIQVSDGAPALCEAGNPGMASGGMGDVLSGIIGGLLAQTLSTIDAAKLGVLLHATAGDQAAQQGGERGLLASDLFPFLRGLVNREING